MPYCSNCGEEVEPGTKFCPNCGASLGGKVSSPKVAPPVSPRGPPRPALASLLTICYLGIGIVFLFLGGETLLFGSDFANEEVLAAALLIFLGIGVLALLTVYGFLRGGRWAPLYISVTGIFAIAAGAVLALSSGVLLLILGWIAMLLGVVTLVYLRFGNARTYLNR